MTQYIAAKKFRHALRTYRDGLLFSAHQLNSRIAAQCINLFFQTAHTGLRCVLRNNLCHCLICHLQIFWLNSGALHRTRQQMALCDLRFFRCSIARKLDHFHTIKQWFRYCINRIGCADEQHIGKIVRYVHIMVGKRAVLLRIKHFQKCTCRIPAIILRQLIHLIKHHDRIRSPASLRAFHDPTGHCAYIRPAMAADLCLITDTPKTNPYVAAMQRLRDTLANTRFSGTRCPHKEQDRSGLFFIERHNCNLLNDTLLYLFQSVMILLQNLLCLIQINRHHFFRLPRQARHKIKVVIKHSVLMTVLALLFHPVQNLFCFSFCFLIHT